MKYFLLTFTADWADEINVPALACMDEVKYNRWLQLEDIYTYTSLGNFGEGFSDQFENCKCGQDFISAGYVSVFEVDESFKMHFDKAKLHYLSLCSIFG